MRDKRNEVLEVALDKLKRELEKEPLSPERVDALAYAIKILISPLDERVAALERQLAEQPIVVNINLASHTVGDLNKVLSRENESDLIEGPSEPLKQTQEDTPDSHAMAEGKYRG